MAREEFEKDKIKGLADEFWKWSKSSYDPINSWNRELYLTAFLNGYECGKEDGLLEARETVDRLMLFGETPPSNIKTIDRYYISC